MAITICLLLLFAGGFSLAARFYLTRRKSVPAIPILGLRAALLAALLLAFFEPMLSFERLQTKPGIVPVLIDASMSMRLFDPDSSVLPFLACLDSLAHASPSPLRFRYYCFGDSFRECPPKAALTFSDLKSLLPASFKDRVVREAPFVLIVSDGNFSNPSFSRGMLQEKACYYLALPHVSPRPYVHSEVLGVRESVPLDSPSTVLVRLHGFASGTCPIVLLCRSDKSPVSQRSITADSGYFSDTALVRLPTGRQGRFVYSVSVVNARDTLRSVSYFSQAVVPQQFTAKILSASPHLDRRFLAQALGGDRQWRIAPQDARRCDALFLIDYTASAAGPLGLPDSKGVVVFLGALPCSSRVELAPAVFSLAAKDPFDTLFARFNTADVAPPSIVQVCRPSFLRDSRTILFGLVREQGKAADKASDSIPFLTMGTFAGRTAVAVAGSELWRMDFLPLSVAGESETPSFMRSMVVFVRQLLLADLRENLVAYPLEPELSERDSIPFSVLAPAPYDAQDATAENYGAHNGFAVRFVIDSSGKKLLDSVYTVPGLNQQNMAGIRLHPFPAGAYRYTCSTTLGREKLSFSDSLYVGKSTPELSVQAQNTLLLSEFALPLKAGNASAVRAAYSAGSSGKRATVTNHVHIRQTWLLLAAIAGFLTLEWVIRRNKGMD